MQRVVGLTDTAALISLASTLLVVAGGIIVAIIQTGRVARDVKEGNRQTSEVIDHVNNVETEIGPDGEPVHKTLRQAIDAGFAANAEDHGRIFRKMGLHDRRLDALDDEVGLDHE